MLFIIKIIEINAKDGKSFFSIVRYFLNSEKMILKIYKNQSKNNF